VTPFDLVIGLGANLGDPPSVFRQAIEGMRAWLEPVAVSPLYQTQAIGPEQPDFLNAAVRGRTLLSAEEVLTRLLDLERAAGRVRRERWGPRCLDLDLLWLHEHQLQTDALTVPHPRLTERAFALYPLLDVAPEAVDPRTGVPYERLRAALVEQRITKRAERWL
jgi:2-amino-4-hydroxy-6-hydroxymethyldihydropteridine diphosphokinase